MNSSLFLCAHLFSSLHVLLTWDLSKAGGASSQSDAWLLWICAVAAVVMLLVIWRDWLVRKQRRRYDEKVRLLVRAIYGIRFPLASIKRPLEELAGQGTWGEEEHRRICTALRHTESLLDLVERLRKDWDEYVWSDKEGIADDELSERLDEVMEFFELYATEAQQADTSIAARCTNCTSELDWKFIASVKRCVEENMDTPGFNVDILCFLLGMSRTSFYNKLKALTDQAPADYMRLIRLDRAKQLLREHRYSVAEVAEKTGFSDAKYFREVFKKHFGLRPMQYVKENP